MVGNAVVTKGRSLSPSRSRTAGSNFDPTHGCIAPTSSVGTVHVFTACHGGASEPAWPAQWLRATGRTDGRTRYQYLISGRGKSFSVLHRVQTSGGASVFDKMFTKSCFLGSKAVGA
jgi:hypothetical protein